MDEPALPVAAPAVEEAPVPAPADLTADQQLIAHLQAQLAVLQGKQDPVQEIEEITAPGSAENILIHFLEDGLVANGQIWYRGQELEFEVGSQAYKDTFDKLGRSWLALRDDEFAQVERWGKVMFRTGPWPGKKMSEAKVSFEALKNGDALVPAPSQDELAKADAIEARRKRAAPRLQAIA